MSSGSGFGGAKRRLIGRPRATHELDDTLLSKALALPIFASDPISSVAYATEAALAVLVAVSLSARHDVLPISVAISALLLIVAISYSQGIKAYEGTSGGSYVFARENLGVLPALVAGAALLTDYILTVAVSVAAGVFALTSAAPSLGAHRVLLSLGCILLLTLGNLRGVREAGLMFAFPTYAFLAVMYVTLGVGIAKCTVGTCPTASVPHPLPGRRWIGLFVLLKAFASGSAALPEWSRSRTASTAFRRPQARNAATTLLLMAGSAVTLFLGVSYLAVQMDARPSGTASVLSQVARATFPAGSPGSAVYYLVQAFTLAILVLAANTSYQGFPRLAALLARDSFLPRQFVNLGDRLAYSNGILVLTAAASGLIVAFGANVNSLIHLYVIGVFTAFTLAQAGMVRYWLRTRRPGWRWSALLNGIGAAATLVVAVIVIATKFAAGAWMVIVAIPIMIVGFYAVRRHYRAVARRLRGRRTRCSRAGRSRTPSSSTSSASTRPRARRSGTRT